MNSSWQEDKSLPSFYTFLFSMAEENLFLHQQRNTESKKEIHVHKIETKLIIMGAVVKESVRLLKALETLRYFHLFQIFAQSTMHWLLLYEPDNSASFSPVVSHSRQWSIF